MGRPSMRASAFPGSRVDENRAGMMATGDGRIKQKTAAGVPAGRPPPRRATGFPYREPSETGQIDSPAIIAHVEGMGEDAATVIDVGDADFERAVLARSEEIP